MLMASICPEKRLRSSPEGFCQLFYGVQRWIPDTPLYTTDVSPVESCQISKSLLRKPALLAQFADALPE